MPTAKKTKKISPVVEEHDEAEERHEDVSVKAKKPIEIDEPEPVHGVLDEKLEEDPLAAPTEDDEAGEELSLDGEELNPFGDRWEE